MGLLKMGKNLTLLKKVSQGLNFAFFLSLSLFRILFHIFSPFLSIYGYCFRFICSVPFSCAIFLSLFLHFLPFTSFLCCSHSFHLPFSPSYLSLSLSPYFSFYPSPALSFLLSLSLSHHNSFTFSLSPFLYLSVEQWPQ